MSEVKFWVLIDHTFRRVQASLDVPIVDLFEDLRRDKVIPQKLSYYECMFYRLLSPVEVDFENDDRGARDISDQIKEACLTKINRKCFDPRWTKVRQLATEFTPNHVHLVIDFPDQAEDCGSRDKGGLGVFEAEDIQRMLRQRNCKIEYVPYEHPRIAVVVNKTSDEYGYLKFVGLEEEGEINILQYLSRIKSPSNHTIPDVQFLPVRGGTVLSMPVAGSRLTALKRPSKKLWSVARQLFEAIAFMHEHNVAHLDIKPQNVVVPLHGGRLSIIDFSVAVRVRGPNVKYKGIVGTEGYMAPEVCEGGFKPLLADLWSCGRTLKEFCWLCGDSADRTDLLKIARFLMDRDPEARPRMSTVLQWMANVQPYDSSAVCSGIRLLHPVSPLRA